MGKRGIYVETVIDAGVDRVWAATQDPEQHVRWDLRFSEIVPGGSVSDSTRRRRAPAVGC